MEAAVMQSPESGSGHQAPADRSPPEERPATPPPATSEAHGKPTPTLADVFDNEALWDADDTDEYILTLAADVETAERRPMAEMRDAGGNSLLHMAAIWNRPRVMEALIRRGVELNDQNVSGHTALDLATHYGNDDLALQLRHYGGKHTCESERDLAMAQRDLAQHQLRDAESDLQDALRLLKSAKQEREELRLERDRLAAATERLTAERDALRDNTAALEAVVGTLQKENQQLLLQLAQLREQLASESDARSNAVHTWHSAQVVIKELRERELTLREREEEMLKIRDGTLQDLDVARELARLAQLDQGVAKQSQLEAERERDQAVRKLLDAEVAIAAEKELWAKRIAKTERDRKNIQIEIDRQTATLRKECDRLEKQLRTSTTLNWSLREELRTKETNAERLDGKIQHLEDTLERIRSVNVRLEEQVTVLEELQRTQHQAWKGQLEKTLRDAVALDLQRIATEVANAADKMLATHEALVTLDKSTRRQLLLQPELTTSLFTNENNPPASPSATLARKPSTVLPFLPDRNSHGQTLSAPVLTSVAALPLDSSVQMPTNGTAAEDMAHVDFHVDTSLITKAGVTARSALHLPLEQVHSSSVADMTTSFVLAITAYLEDVAIFVSRNWRHFRKQVEALEKMVERKDELIARFNQHRRDKPKKQSARLRECIYKPLL